MLLLEFCGGEEMTRLAGEHDVSPASCHSAIFRVQLYEVIQKRDNILYRWKTNSSTTAGPAVAKAKPFPTVKQTGRARASHWRVDAAVLPGRAGDKPHPPSDRDRPAQLSDPSRHVGSGRGERRRRRWWWWRREPEAGPPGRDSGAP